MVRRRWSPNLNCGSTEQAGFLRAPQANSEREALLDGVLHDQPAHWTLSAACNAILLGIAEDICADGAPEADDDGDDYADLPARLETMENDVSDADATDGDAERSHAAESLKRKSGEEPPRHLR